ncbi:MAG: class I SAM-dependent rRNA methyltransferase [Syntrophothermus sp.]
MTKKIKLKKYEDRRIKEGHLWIFSNEIVKPDNDIQNGEIVEVFDFAENYVCTGFFNRNSLIAVRIISINKVEDLKELLRQKILRADKLRKDLYSGRNSYRMIFSEADQLPGLIIDKYENTYVMQVYSFGMEANINLIVDILKQELKAENIFTKNEEYFRTLEGLPVKDEVYFGEDKESIIEEFGILYKIDFKGHKTGFYFDQTDNRIFVERFAKGKSFIDAFCNAGGFGLHALKAGAESVIFVDSSKSEIENAKANVELNGLRLDRCTFIAKDVFDYFEELVIEQKLFDIVMIDPPAFAKSKKNINQAIKGYEKLNRLALQLTKDEGFLITSSCSYHLDDEEFINVVKRAAYKTNKNLQLIHFYNASMDHPRLPAMSETKYLKFGVFKVYQS